MSQWKCSHCDGPIGSLAGLAGGTVTCPYCLTPVAVSPRQAADRSPVFLKKALLVGLLLGLVAAGAVGLVVKSDPVVWAREWQAELVAQLDGGPVVPQVEIDTVAAATKDAGSPVAADVDDRQVSFRQTACTEGGQAQAGALESATAEECVAVDESVSRSASVDGSEFENATLSGPENLGLSCDEMVHLIQQYYPAEFYAQTPLDSFPQQLRAKIDGAEVILWSHEGQLESVTISGRFDSTNLALLLATIVDRIMPNWGIENAGDWFSKAIHRCDNETLVSTLCDDVELTITTSDERSAFWVFFQPDWS